MKAILKDNRRYILRFDKDEDVIAQIAAFMQTENITACTFNGVGACSEADLWYYNPFVKDYRKKPYMDSMEIVSLIGNGALKDGQPIIHAHGSFARNDFSLIGGHVAKLVVSATCEVFLIKLDGEMNRSLDAGMNLNLLV